MPEKRTIHVSIEVEVLDSSEDLMNVVGRDVVACISLVKDENENLQDISVVEITETIPETVRNMMPVVDPTPIQ